MNVYEQGILYLKDFFHDEIFKNQEKYFSYFINKSIMSCIKSFNKLSYLKMNMKNKIKK